MTPHQKGLLLTGFGGLVLSFDIPLLRLANADVWTVQFVRPGLGLIMALLIWGAVSLWRRRAITLLPGKTGILVALLYGVASTIFVGAIFHTTAANIVFILSLNSMFAALLGWLWLGERPARATLATMAVTVAAVLLIVGDSLHTGNWLGDLMTLCCAAIIATVITITRRSGRDMGFAPMIGGLLPLAVAAVMLAPQGVTKLAVENPVWLILDGGLLIPISFWCLATGPKYISGPEVAMFYLFETVLAPVWMWLVFREAPTPASLAGGVIIIAALLAHTAWQYRRLRKRV
ncbi:MAG: DMT family transporter [Oricola sp.]